MGNIGRKPIYNGSPKIRYKISSKNYRIRLRKSVINIIGNKCIRCGFSDFRALQIDHKNGGGSKEQKKHGIQSMYVYYRDHPKEAKRKLQILCANCNWIKRHENNENRK